MKTKGIKMKTCIAYSDRIGNKTSRRATILNRPISAGGFGRRLTSSECVALRALGWTVSERYHVVRQVGDIDSLGIVYKPALGGGLEHAGIYVRTK